MGKSRTMKNYEEAKMLILKFQSNPHMLALAMIQLVEREKVRVLNNYLEARGERKLPTDPPGFPSHNGPVEWVVDVPREWVSLTGRNS